MPTKFNGALLVLALVACMFVGLGVLDAEREAEAGQANTTVSLGRIPNLVVTADVHTSSVLATDVGSSASKRDVAMKWVINGMDIHVLMRVEQTPSGLFIDLIADNAIGELSTRVTALSITTNSHPTAGRDAIDTATLVAAGGS